MCVSELPLMSYSQHSPELEALYLRDDPLGLLVASKRTPLLWHVYRRSAGNMSCISVYEEWNPARLLATPPSKVPASSGMCLQSLLSFINTKNLFHSFMISLGACFIYMDEVLFTETSKLYALHFSQLPEAVNLVDL
jgi:hypothetical protein